MIPTSTLRRAQYALSIAGNAIGYVIATREGNELGKWVSATFVGIGVWAALNAGEPDRDADEDERIHINFDDSGSLATGQARTKREVRETIRGILKEQAQERRESQSGLS